MKITQKEDELHVCSTMKHFQEKGDLSFRSSGKIPFESNIPRSNKSLKIPLAHRKGVRICTKHPLSKFVL